MARKGHVVIDRTIPEWAEILGISYMSAYEKIRGWREFRIWELEKLREVLGVHYIDDVLYAFEKEREKIWKKKEQKQ